MVPNLNDLGLDRNTIGHMSYVAFPCNLEFERPPSHFMEHSLSQNVMRIVHNFPKLMFLSYDKCPTGTNAQ